MKIAHLYPQWKPGRHSFAMDVLGRALADSLAASDEVVMLAKGDGEEMHGRAPIRFVGGTLNRVLASPGFRLWPHLTRLGLVSKSRPLSSTVWAFLGYALSAGLHVRRSHVDIAHIHIYEQLAPVIRRVAPSTRIVLHMHDHSQLQQEEGLVRRRLESCDLLVGCSDYMAEATRERFPDLADRIVAIPNSIPDPKPRHSGGDGKSIFFIGRLSPEKGVHVLVEAFNKVAASDSAARLTLIGPDAVPGASVVESHLGSAVFRDVRRFYGRGSDDYSQFLRGLVAEEVRDRVEFAGELDNDEASERLRSADMLVMPSIWNEPFGMPVLEAMNAGLPVVATHMGAFDDTVVEGVTGRLVEPGDVDGLADAIAGILSDPAHGRSLGEAGRRRAVEVFGWDGYVAAWKSAYEGLLGRN